MIRKKPPAIASLYLLTMTLCAPAHSAIVAYEFAGVITQITDKNNLLTGIPIAPITSTFSGKLVYDDSAAYLSTSPPSTLYPVIRFSATIDGIYGFSGNINTPTLAIADNAGSFGDYFSVVARDPDTVFDIAVGDFNLLQLFLTDSSATVFSNRLLPSKIDLNDFDGRRIIFRGGQHGSLPGSLDSEYAIEGVLASLTPVPAPPALLLLVSGLLGLINFGRRKTRVHQDRIGVTRRAAA